MKPSYDEQDHLWSLLPLDEHQMRSIIHLLDVYDTDPQHARLLLDRACHEAKLSARHCQAVRILFLLPTSDANELLAAACKDERARLAFLSLRGQ
jgi:hypothetical protein